MTKVLCAGYPACAFHDCPHASPPEPYAFPDGSDCREERECQRWQWREGIGAKRSRCRCVIVSSDHAQCRDQRLPSERDKKRHKTDDRP